MAQFDIPQDIFDKIEDAAANFGGNNIRDGSFLFAIKNLLYEPKREAPTFIAELIVVVSEAMPGMYQVGGQACQPEVPGAVLVQPNAVGSQASFTTRTQDPNLPSGPANVKSIMLAISGQSEADFNAEAQAAKAKRLEAHLKGVAPKDLPRTPFNTAMSWMTNPAQPMRGMLIRCVTNRILNKGKVHAENRGKVLVLPSWTHVPCTAEGNTARRALIEASLPIPADLAA